MKKLGYAQPQSKSTPKKDPNTHNAPYHCSSCVAKQALIEQLQRENAELKSVIKRALENDDLEVLRASFGQPVAPKSAVKTPKLGVSATLEENAPEDSLHNGQKIESPKFSDNPTISIK